MIRNTYRIVHGVLCVERYDGTPGGIERAWIYKVEEFKHKYPKDTIEEAIKGTEIT